MAEQYTIPRNVKPENTCNFSIKFITSSKVLVVPKLSLHTLGHVADTLTSFKQILDATSLKLISY
jgi:hypothetical protein